MKSINLPAGTELLPFNVLERYIAAAIHPEADQQPQRAACAWQLERDLMRDVQDGKLQLRHPVTKKRLPPEAGYVAQIQSVVTVDALRKYAADEHCLAVTVAAETLKGFPVKHYPAPPIQGFMLQLAEARLTQEKFALLQHKLNTGSPTAQRIMDAIKPGEWESAVGDTRQFNDIRCRLEAAIDDWINGNPTSKSFVWPNIFHDGDVAVGPEFQNLILPTATSCKAVTAAPSTWHLHEPMRCDGLAWPLYKLLKLLWDAGEAIPTPAQVLTSWDETKPPGIESVTKKGVTFIPSGKSKGTDDIPGLRKRISNLTTPPKPKSNAL